MLLNKQTKLDLAILLMAAALCMAAVSYAAPMGTAFTYQGQLADANSPAEGLYDFEFEIYDGLDGGTQQGSTLSDDDKDVIDGYFTVTLDFGAGVFTGDARWLQIAVRRANSTEDFTTLSPRQELTPTPYALYAKTADTGHSLDAADGSPTNAVYVDNNGNVGIGTTSPGAKLHVSAGHIKLDAGYALRAGSTNMVYQNAGNTIINALSTDEIYFTGSGLPKMVIQNSTGNIGIGTLNPEGLLHITRYGDKQLMLGHDNQPLREWYFEVDGAAKMTLNNEAAGSPIMVMSFDSNMGNVGIGTSSPDAKLTVDGAFLREGSTMYGSNADTHINLGTTSTTGTNGQNYSSATVGGGWDNTASGFRSTISGGALNEASAFQTAIGGGGMNTASGDNATVGGGGANTASGDWSTVGGGEDNKARGDYATVGGGNSSTASGREATVGGGGVNNASGASATVGGGWWNLASGSQSTISGGASNRTFTGISTVGGGAGNNANGIGATIGGGRDNTVDGYYHATISGGQDNMITISGQYATIGGGRENTTNLTYATVGGGYSNDASSYNTTISGGYDNAASDAGATVGGGQNNNASSSSSTISGGLFNTASGQYATVAGGNRNTASGSGATVAGGGGNASSGWIGNIASGDWATVGGGYWNVASGYYSFAAGRRAKANHQGSFVWGDSTDADITSTINNQWKARASGGVYFYTNSGLTSGLYVSAGGNSWNSISDRATKENFTPVDRHAILQKLADLPVQEYNLKSQDESIRHIGPVAQDFATFGYGESDKAINMEDADGIALAAIQGLYEIVKEKESEIADQAAEITALKKQTEEIATLRNRLATMEATVSNLINSNEGGQL